MFFGLLPRKSSFNLVLLKGLHELGFFERHVIAKERSFCRKYLSASSVVLLENSDSSSAGESSSENEVITVPAKRKRYICKGRNLSWVVTTVCKSLSWKAAKEIPFRKSMKKYGFSHSIDAFRMIIHTFASVEMHREVYALLKDIVFYFQEAGFDLNMIFHLFTVHTPPDNVLVADVLIKVFAANAMLDFAIDVVKQTTEIGLRPSIKSCNFLLKCLAEASRREHLLYIFERMKSFGPSPNVFTYTIMMNFRYTNLQGQQLMDLEEASKTLEEIWKRQISPSAATYATYVHGLCRAGKVDFALDFVRELRDNKQPVNCYCYNAIIHRYCATGEVNTATSIFYEMKSFGIMPDAYSYSILIDGFCRCMNFEKGLELIEEMKANNIKPTIVSYSSLLNGFCKTGEMEIVLKIFYELESFGYGYDEIAYNILINGFFCRENLTSAHNLLVEMISNKAPDALHYKPLIRGLCQIGSFDKALEYLSVMVQEGCLPDTITCNFIVKSYCAKGHLAEALQLINEMVEQGITPNGYTYSEVVNSLCKDRKTEKALEVIPVLLKRNTMHVAICSSLIDGFVKQSNLEKAYMLFEKIQKLGVSPDIIMWTIHINTLCKMGQVEKAYKIFGNMIRKGFNPDNKFFGEMIPSPDNIAYTSMIDGLCRKAYMSVALELFKDLPKMPCVVTFSCLLGGFCKNRRMDKAKMLLDEMRRQDVSPNIKTYDMMIRGYKRLGMLDLAYGMFSAMLQEGILPDKIMLKTLGVDSNWIKHMKEG